MGNDGAKRHIKSSFTEIGDIQHFSRNAPFLEGWGKTKSRSGQSWAVMNNAKPSSDRKREYQILFT